MGTPERSEQEGTERDLVRRDFESLRSRLEVLETFAIETRRGLAPLLEVQPDQMDLNREFAELLLFHAREIASFQRMMRRVLQLLRAEIVEERLEQLMASFFVGLSDTEHLGSLDQRIWNPKMLQLFSLLLGLPDRPTENDLESYWASLCHFFEGWAQQNPDESFRSAFQIANAFLDVQQSFPQELRIFRSEWQSRLEGLSDAYRPYYLARTLHFHPEWTTREEMMRIISSFRVRAVGILIVEEFAFEDQEFRYFLDLLSRTGVTELYFVFSSLGQVQVEYLYSLLLKNPFLKQLGVIGHSITPFHQQIISGRVQSAFFDQKIPA